MGKNIFPEIDKSRALERPGIVPHVDDALFAEKLVDLGMISFLFIGGLFRTVRIEPIKASETTTREIFYPPQTGKQFLARGGYVNKILSLDLLCNLDELIRRIERITRHGQGEVQRHLGWTPPVFENSK